MSVLTHFPTFSYCIVDRNYLKLLNPCCLTNCVRTFYSNPPFWSCRYRRFRDMEASVSRRLQPIWSPPDEVNTQKLCLYNSFTRRKDVFIPLSGGRRVTFYNCGPTVYDATHMGHARNYLTFDIIRRVLENYFGYELFYVMNITDIDDKIIKRARQNYLYQKYVEQTQPLSKVLEDCSLVVSYFEEKLSKTVDVDKLMIDKRIFASFKESVVKFEPIVKELCSSSCNSATINSDDDMCKKFLLEIKDLLSDWLDHNEGHSIVDNEIFTSLPQYWEQQFHNDMESLNILPPSCLTRVSEYIPEIVLYIEKIIERGLAYVSNGSVYFDVSKFNSIEKHFYAKLVPEAFGDKNAIQEAEGDLSVTEDRLQEKKSVTDFALWKLSKPGEPSWDSPWSRGRPGWHIECSAMASEIIGSSIDIHGGGFDLKFPHHDNELAQAEAYFNSSRWVNYFLHSGHLTIAGCKMSKSLKNFVSVSEALKTYSSRQIRFTFLLHAWNETLDYSDNTMELALSYEKTVNEFFLTVKHLFRVVSKDGTDRNMVDKWSESDLRFNERLIQCQNEVHLALCDNINTRLALASIREFVTVANAYMQTFKGQYRCQNVRILRNAAVYITRIFNIFGLISNIKDESIGFPSSDSNASSLDVENVVMPFLDALVNFRGTVRTEARGLKSDVLLNECDKLRDVVLPSLGVRLEDKENEQHIIKLVGKAELLKEKELKDKMDEKLRLEKLARKAEAENKLSAIEAQSKINPSTMFINQTDKYAKFDAQGIPTHDMNGRELSKSQLKKLNKLFQQQEKKYLAYLDQTKYC